MAIALTVLNDPSGVDNSQKRMILEGTAVLTGSYTAGGEAITWTGLEDSAGNSVLLNSLSTAPLWAEFQIGIPGSTPLWYGVQYNYKTNKLQFYDTGAASGDGFAELAASTYPTDLTTCTLYFKAEFLSE